MRPPRAPSAPPRWARRTQRSPDAPSHPPKLPSTAAHATAVPSASSICPKVVEDQFTVAAARRAPRSIPAMIPA